jgi:aryl-alcohol dehydrogenase-like predicted oxidoreductase
MSKFVLGTAQFGLNYGVNNRNGQVELDEVKSILECAKKNRINTLDTAPAYGNSEEVLGKTIFDDFQIITKTTSIANGIDKVIDDFHQSLGDLNKASIYGLLVHNINEIECKNFNFLIEKLDELKQEGKVKKIGFSVYTPEQIDFLLENFDFDLLQLPINIFDQRLIIDGKLKKLKEKGIETHARSIFLQGLLLMEYDLIPSYFLPIIKKIDLFHGFAKNMSLSRLELALGFVMGIKEIDKIVIGVNTVAQLQEIIKATHVSVNPLDFRGISVDNRDYINPSLWKI